MCNMWMFKRGKEKKLAGSREWLMIANASVMWRIMCNLHVQEFLQKICIWLLWLEECDQCYDKCSNASHLRKQRLMNWPRKLRVWRWALNVKEHMVGELLTLKNARPVFTEQCCCHCSCKLQYCTIVQQESSCRDMGRKVNFSSWCMMFVSLFVAARGVWKFFNFSSWCFQELSRR